MNLNEQLRVEILRTINTLRGRFLNTADQAEQSVIEQSIDSLNGMLSIVNQAALLQAANILADATGDVEKAIAAAKTGPFDGYLATLEERFRNLNNLSGEMHASEKLPPASADDMPATPMPAGPSAATASVLTTPTDTVAAPVLSKDYFRLKSEYQTYFDACRLRAEFRDNAAYYVKRLNHGRPTYEQVGKDLGGIPWIFIGVIHAMECGFNFAAHLHNGDPLTGRTAHVPAARPVEGSPPFTWRHSAVDALKMKRFHEVDDWTVPHMLFLLEKFNGFGYRMRQAVTPYLWSFSNLYQKGKYVKDGVFDSEAVSKQCGAALVLKSVLAT
jgi:lysozyme family protein